MKNLSQVHCNSLPRLRCTTKIYSAQAAPLPPRPQSFTSFLTGTPPTVMAEKEELPHSTSWWETVIHKHWPNCTYRVLASPSVARAHQMPPRRVEKLMLWVADLTNKKSKMGKSKQKNFLPFPPMLGIMAQDTVAHCGLPGDMEGDWGTGWVLLWSYDLSSNVVILFGLPSFWPGLFSPHSCSPGIDTLNKTLACTVTFASGSVSRDPGPLQWWGLFIIMISYYTVW